MRNNKRTSFISVLIILLCLSLCIGATFAYFTDSVKSEGNKIKAGKLDIDLQLLDRSTSVWNSIATEPNAVFDYELWEPGYTDIKVLRVVNNGNLAIKWEARLVSDTAASELADVIQVYVKTGDGNGEVTYPTSAAELATWGTKTGTLKEFINTTNKVAAGELLVTDSKASTYIAIALHMPVEADNTYQDKLLGEFDIEIVATQFTYESDAFGSDYDEGAKFPCDHPATEVLEGYDPTYEQTGLTDGKKCIICTEIVEKQEEIPMLVEKVYHNLEFTRHEGENGAVYYSVRGKNKDDLESADIVIPSTYYGYPVTEIDDEAFSGFYGLTSVEIPDSVTSIGEYALYFCEDLTSVTMPESITSIGIGALWGCKSLTSLTIPNGVTSLECSFGHCDSLTHVEIPDSVTSIDDRAFYDCDNLERVTIGEGVTNIGYKAFARCLKLESFTFGSNVTSIGESAFEQCVTLTSITLPDNLTDIGNSAFNSCTRLTNCTIPDDVTTIGDSAFKSCKSLTSITLGNRVTSIGIAAFSNCEGLTDFIIGDSVTSIGNFAFSRCLKLKNLTIGKSVTSIGDEAFKSCLALTSITIPDSVISIGERAFQWCNKLTDITLGNGLKNIDYAAFGWCTALKNVTFGSNGTMSVDSGLFNGSTALTAIYITDLAAWCNIDFSGTSYHPLSTVENLYLNGEILAGELVISDDITKIGDYTFYSYDKLTSVKIGNGVTSIGSGAFGGCDSLTNAVFEQPEGWYTEYYVEDLVIVDIPATDLADPTTAATFLTGTYCWDEWHRTEQTQSE